MNITDSLKVALRSLAANKMRSVLTMLGMIIGVGAVISLMSVGNGAQASITSQIEGMGTNLLFITPGNQSQGGIRMGQGSAPTLTLDDANAIGDPNNVPSVVAVAPEADSFSQVIAGPQNTLTRVVGTTPSYQDVRNFHVAEGDFISQQNVDAASTVAVLGAQAASDLFGNLDPIGQSIRLGQGNFRVIGVMETKGSQATGNQDDQIIIPITTLRKRLANNHAAMGGSGQNVNTIYVTVADKSLMTTAVQQIGALLDQRHRVAQDDFTIRSQDDLLSTATQITGVMTVLLGSIAGISLIVGGIGIMNIMLVSVTERTREIGIRKAVGAKRGDILMQFMIEAAVVSLLGGAIGIALGAGLSTIIGRVNLGGQSLHTVVAPDAILLAVGVSAAIGLFFGIYPASKAAGLHPIEALRYE